MLQSKKESIFESITGVAIGFFIALTSQLIMFPMFNIHIKLQDNFIMSFYFTIISITRGYIVRRWFNARLRKLHNLNLTKGKI